MMRDRVVYFFVVMLCFFSAGAVGASQDLIVSRAVFEDKAATLNIEQVIQQEFTPAGIVLSEGYTAAAHWIRLKVNASPDGGMLVLRIRPAYLDAITLFESDQEHSGRWVGRTIGDRYPYDARDRPAATLSFIIHPHPSSLATTYYLRLKTTSTSLLNVEALSLRDAQIRDTRQDMVHALYLGVMLWFLFWAISDYVNSRERVVLYFIFYQTASILFDLAFMGYTAAYVTETYPELVDQLTCVVVFAISFTAVLFHRTFLKMYAPSKTGMAVSQVLLMLFLVELMMMGFGYVQQALKINTLVIFLLAPFFLWLALSSKREGVPDRRVVILIYGIQTFSVLVSTLPMLGWVAAVEWNLYAVLIHGLISDCLIFLMLYRRSGQLSVEHQKAIVSVELMHKQMEMERMQRAQQGQLMAMLTHELKSPLAAIKFAVSSLGREEKADSVNVNLIHIEHATRDMNTIIDRCIQADRMDQKTLVVDESFIFLGHFLEGMVCSIAENNRIRIDCPEQLSVHTDVTLLQIILTNLLDNALKYSADRTVVEMDVREMDRDGVEGVQIAVVNFVGKAGFPDETGLFEKYYRAAGAQRLRGSGLGVWLIRGIARRLGGEVEYLQKEGKVVFQLWLPH